MNKLKKNRRTDIQQRTSKILQSFNTNPKHPPMPTPVKKRTTKARRAVDPASWKNAYPNRRKPTMAFPIAPQNKGSNRFPRFADGVSSLPIASLRSCPSSGSPSSPRPFSRPGRQSRRAPEEAPLVDHASRSFFPEIVDRCLWTRKQTRRQPFPFKFPFCSVSHRHDSVSADSETEVEELALG